MLWDFYKAKPLFAIHSWFSTLQCVHYSDQYNLSKAKIMQYVLGGMITDVIVLRVIGIVCFVYVEPYIHSLDILSSPCSAEE